MPIKTVLRITLEWGAVALLLALVLHRFLPSRAEAPSPANARSFTLRGLDGQPVDPSLYRDKAVLLNFWAPWCAPCRMEIPWLQKLQAEQQGKLLVVGVVADPAENARAAAMMQKAGITYLLVEDSASLVKAFGNPSVLPASFYLSPTAHVVHTVTGVVPEYTMRRYAADAIEGK